jgi:hypothetical protein
MTIENDFDFGFSFEDEEAVTKTTTAPTPTANNDQLLALQAKIDTLLDAQEQTLQTALVTAMEEKHKAKLKELEGLILPLLYNLMKNPDKPIINWPNREAVIKKQIEKIQAVTRG